MKVLFFTTYNLWKNNLDFPVNFRLPNVHSYVMREIKSKLKLFENMSSAHSHMCIYILKSSTRVMYAWHGYLNFYSETLLASLIHHNARLTNAKAYQYGAVQLDDDPHQQHGSPHYVHFKLSTIWIKLQIHNIIILFNI